MPLTECGCWIWLGSVTEDGYGRTSIGGKLIATHRASWIVHKGPIPTGMSVLHQCDMPPCFNPDHLFLGTQLDNMRDMAMKRRANIPRGEKNPKAILTSDDVISIYRSVGPAADVAEIYGVDRGTVYSIRNGHNWKHITEGII